MKSRRFLSWRLAGGLGLCAGLAAPAAFAQDQGPVVFTRAEQMPKFAINDLEAWLDVMYRHESDRSSSAGSETRTSEDLIRETFNIKGTSYIIHPNLVDIRFSGGFGLEEDFLASDSNKSSSIGPVYNYDLTAVVLRKEIAPLTIFTRRYEELITQPFGGTITSTVDTSGLQWDINSKWMPTHLAYAHTTTEQSGGGLTQPFTLTEDAFQYSASLNLGEHQGMSWSLSDRMASEEGATSQQYNELQGNASHWIAFGPQYENNLTSSVDFYDETGDFNRQRLRWDELMLLRHSKTFETNYRYSFDQDVEDVFTRTQHQGEVGFRHRLYESLTTTGRAGAILLEQDPGYEQTEGYGNLDVDYRKLVPYGVLSAGVGLSYDTQDTQASGGAPAFVPDERHVFNGATPFVTLSRQNVVAGSVRVRPQSRDANDPPAGDYVEGVDYTVVPVGAFTQIHRPIGSRIDDDQVVLITYQARVPGKTSVQTLANTFTIRYDIDQGPLRGLGAYARFLHQQQSISTDLPGALIPDNVDDYTLGADYRFWYITLNGEYELRESNISPYSAYRLYARYSQPITPQAMLGVNLNYSVYDYEQPTDHVSFLLATATFQYRFTRNFSLRAGLGWRSEDDSLRGHTEGLEESLELNWRHRQTEIYLTGHNANLTGPGSKTDSTFLEVGFRRYF